MLDWRKQNAIQKKKRQIFRKRFWIQYPKKMTKNFRIYGRCVSSRPRNRVYSDHDPICRPYNNQTTMHPNAQELHLANDQIISRFPNNQTWISEWNTSSDGFTSWVSLSQVQKRGIYSNDGGIILDSMYSEDKRTPGCRNKQMWTENPHGWVQGHGLPKVTCDPSHRCTNEIISSSSGRNEKSRFWSVPHTLNTRENDPDLKKRTTRYCLELIYSNQPAVKSWVYSFVITIGRLHIKIFCS